MEKSIQKAMESVFGQREIAEKSKLRHFQTGLQPIYDN